MPIITGSRRNHEEGSVSRSRVKNALQWHPSAAAFAALLLVLLPAAPAAAQFLDITSLTPGTSGSFAGTLGGVAVSGSITTTAPSFSFSPTGSDFFETTIDNSSPQYSYAGIYAPTQTLGDKLGYVKLNVPNETATFTINFASAVTNPIFHIANLDGANFDFGATPGLLGLTLLSGNGGGGEGLVVNGTVIADANSNTIVAFPPSSPPPTSGARSAYGSVQLRGTFTTLITQVRTDGGGDGGSFTLSTSAPEPSTLALTLCVPALGIGSIVARRRKGPLRPCRKS